MAVGYTCCIKHVKGLEKYRKHFLKLMETHFDDIFLGFFLNIDFDSRKRYNVHVRSTISTATSKLGPS